MNLTVDFFEKDQGHLVELRGEIDIYTAPQLKEALIPLTKKTGTTICVDLNEVTYLDSTGLGIFINALKSTKKHKSHLKLIRLQERVLRLFQVTGLHEIMTIQSEAEVKAENGNV